MADVYEHCVFPQSGLLAQVVLVNNSIMTWINQKEPFPMQFLIPLPVYRYGCLEAVAVYSAKRMLQGLYSTLAIHLSQDICQF